MPHTAVFSLPRLICPASTNRPRDAAMMEAGNVQDFHTHPSDKLLETCGQTGMTATTRDKTDELKYSMTTFRDPP